MLRRRFVLRLTSWLVILSLLLSNAPLALAQDGPVYLPLINQGKGQVFVSTSDLLFRVQVRVATPSQAARLAQPGIVVLAQGEETATLLVDSAQLEFLAKAGFQPRRADVLESLVKEQGPDWLSPSLQPLLEEAAAARQRMDAAVGRAGDQVEALAGVRAAMAVLAGEQRAALNELTELDSDGDGLTDTEESWWCTDPLNPNSDGDAQGYSDGLEVDALLDATQPRNVRWGYGPPFGPPAAWPDFNNNDGDPNTPACNDGDMDTIPDYAESRIVGTWELAESTDNDKFDDGQELFGITYCPGGDAGCGETAGSYPRIEYWNFIKNRMPNWVLPPGDSPFVAAFPVPEVTVEAGSWTVERVTTITTSEGEMTQQSKTYETSVTRGQSDSIANTTTWNEWEGVSQGVERSAIVSSIVVRQPMVCEPPGSLKCKAWGTTKWVVGGGGGVVSKIGSWGAAAVCIVPDPSDATIVVTPAACVAALGLEAASGGLFKVADSGWQDMTSSSPQEVQSRVEPAKYQGEKLYCEAPKRIGSGLANQVTCDRPNTETDQVLNLGYSSNYEGIGRSSDGVQFATSNQNELLASRLYDISYAISQPRLTETRTSGKSWGGAQTTTHEVYEEHTISQGEAFTTGQNWSTAWAVDSSHAADLTFRYSVRNAGTEYARELSNVVFNIYIGDDTLPTISYPAWEQFAGGKLDNLFPVGPNTPAGVVSSKTFASKTIPLSLEQMKRIDLGERLTVKVEGFSYGADELFYVDAIAGGVTVYIEDGVEDGDESVDMYVIPTWGAETVQDVLARYFPHGEDIDGVLNSLWTPEFNGVGAPTWHEHYLSDIAWWNVYLTQPDAGDTPLGQLPAQAGAGVLFRFNRDSDRDGYNDRAEFRYYCALSAGHADQPRCADGYLRPEIHPQPEVLGGYVIERSGNQVTVKLALENTGTFDAYGIDAVMYSPDTTTTIGNNTVGGNGKVRPGNKVTVGSMIKAPDLSNWDASRARPYAAGEYSGAADRTFTFTAQTPGVVGIGSTAVAWNDGTGNNGVLQLGGSYHAPLPLDVAHGVQVGFNTGTIDAGARFTVQALTSRDTFTYTINSEPFTPPVIVVSYSDPQGSHRFVTPVQLPALGASLASHTDAMLKGIGLQIVATAPFAATGANTTNLVVYNPHPATIVGGHLHLNFVSDGKLVLEKSFTLDIPAGPTTFSAEWSTTEFSADYKPNGDNLLIAFWTDSENNIIDSAARPLNSFAADPKSAAASDAAGWDFGTVTQGEVLKHTVSVASVGELDLLAYASASAGLAASQVGSKPLGIGDVTSYELTLDTRTLPVGPYSGAITLRTSDPTHPVYTVQVSGVIAAVTGDAYARTATDRPLDVEVWVPGNRNRGEWITYEHPNNSYVGTLHPVKVLNSARTLLGVGKYATDFEQGIMSRDMFGDGRDGTMPPSGALDDDIGVGYGIVHSGAAGTLAVDVSDAHGVWRIQPGDAVLIHQTQGTGAGCWELNRAVSDFGGGRGTYQLAQPLMCNYGSGGNGRAQIMRVPQYSACNVTGTITPRFAWNGSWGGIVTVMCNGTLNVTGSIDASGAGFRGVSHGAVYRNQTGYQGEGYLGGGGQTTASNGNGGGGGQGTQDGGGGAGGANGTNGGNGGNSPVNGRIGGAGGSAVGTPELTTLFLGGAGGEGGADEDGGNPGGGGNGGGIVAIFARTIQNSGSILSNGSRGGDACQGCGGGGGWGMAGGGGGSGGSILLRTDQVLVNSNITAVGGGGGASHSNHGVWGGTGGVGRIRIEHCSSSTQGSTNPSPSMQGIKCYISEQVEATSTTRLNLQRSTSETRTYIVQYGHRLHFTTLGENTASIRVPAGVWTAASIDLLISGVETGDVTFKLDVGADGTWDWEQTRNVTNAATFSSPDLAAALAPFVNGAGQVDVPVRVYLSKPGQVLLTNMAVTRNQSVELAPAFALSGSPIEGAVVSLNATVANSGAADSGPLTVSYYATRPSPLAPQYIGSVFVTDVLKAGVVATPLQWNTLGFTGLVTVTAVVDPYNRIAETNETNNQTAAALTILTRPDLTVPLITPSDPEPLAGKPVTITVTLRNGGQTPGNSQVVTLYNGNPVQGGAALGSRTVSIPANATRAAVFTWTPPSPGPYRLLARVDRTGVVNEFDETNNDTWLDLHVGLASPVLLDSGAAGEPAYTPARGYGFVDEGLPDRLGVCGANSQRRDPGGELVYRFDHLQPGHYYHLDLEMTECDQARRTQTISIDGHVVAAPEALGDQQTHRMSILIDPALYADRTIRVAVAAADALSAIVDRVALHDIDYRYADAGAATEPQCTAGVSYGWIDGDPFASWGKLPYQSFRTELDDNQLRYCFKALDPAKRYRLHLSFWQASGVDRLQTILLDGVPAAETGNVLSGQRRNVTVPLEQSAYQQDRQIDLSIVRTNAGIGALVNLVVLEEETLAPTAPAPTGYAVLALTPATASMGQGQTASMDIWVRTAQPVDSASAYLNFDPSYLQVASITPGSSFPVVLQNSYENNNGRMDFAAGALTGSALSSDFLLATVVFTGVATTPGTAVNFAAAPPRRSDVTYAGAPVFSHAENVSIIVTQDVATLAGRVVLEGRPAPPHAQWRAPLLVTLSTTPGGPPLASFAPTSDENGAFVVSGISPGVYSVGVKMANSLRSTVVVTFTNAQANIDFGLLPGGDADDDNYVTVRDFSILRTGYGKCQGDAGYDGRADFNGDSCVLMVDFSILRKNFGGAGDVLRGSGASLDMAEPLAVLHAAPATTAVVVGELVTVSLQVDAGALAVDGAAAYLTFDPSVVQIVGVTAGAALPDLLQNEVDNQAGAMRFAAGGLEQSASGVFDLATVELRAVGPGDARLRFEQGSPSQSDVTAAGVSVLQAVVDATVTVQAPGATESTPSTIFLPIVGGRE